MARLRSAIECTVALTFYAGSIILGLALGAAFVVSWRIFVPRGATSRVMSELISIARDMTRTDEVDKFLGLYKRLFINVGGYLARNIAGLAFACLPMVLVWTLLVPPALDAWGSRTDVLAAYPELDSLAIAEPQGSRSEDQAATRLTVMVDGNKVSTYAPHGRLAICWSQAYCTFFVLLGFEVRETPNALIAGTSFIVIRPQHSDDNLLWPYLSDLEFTFLIAFVLATLGTFLPPRRRR